MLPHTLRIHKQNDTLKADLISVRLLNSYEYFSVAVTNIFR
jgi:hypothetical protein